MPRGKFLPRAGYSGSSLKSRNKWHTFVPERGVYGESMDPQDVPWNLALNGHNPPSSLSESSRLGDVRSPSYNPVSRRATIYVNKRAALSFRKIDRQFMQPNLALVYCEERNQQPQSSANENRSFDFLVGISAIY